MADINLVVGAGHKFAALNLVDNANGNFISATFSNQSVSNDHTEFAVIEINPSNPDSVSAIGLTPGAGIVIISAHADYTDPGDGLNHSEDFSVTKTFEVT